MTIPPFESSDNLQMFVAKASKEEFQEALASFSLVELAQCMNLLQKQPLLEAKSKLESLFQFMQTPTMLEMLGKHFSVPSFLNFLEFLTEHPQYHSRLTFILVGLDPLIFSKALHLLHGDLLHILKQEGLLEPLQYQLTQFAHEGETLKLSIEQSIQQCLQEFSSIIPEDLTQDALQAIIDRIDGLRNELIDYLERASTALAIVWHTDRVDLIEKISTINETIQHQLTHYIGHSAFDNLAATGLYATLGQTLSNIFDSSLRGNDASIEGMTRLSIWHLKDYWELGLLPCIQHFEELDLDPQIHSEKARWDYQQRLICLVQQQLERLGIGKIEDLKKFHLFSKSLLKTYIEQHHHLLLKS